jgi:hypothetical protein
MTPADLALWLAHNVDAIACDEAAGQIYADVKAAVSSIERVINRPIPEQFCGTCTTPVDSTPCDLALYAPREATEVTCPRCKTTHNIERLFDQTLNNSDDKSFTISELHRTVLPAVREYVPPRTLQHWAARGRLVPTGYTSEGEPRFMLADVRRLRDMKQQSEPTGAAAHRRAAC